MSVPNARARRAARLGIQGVGFLVGLVLLGWCVRAALSPENREQLARLSEASPGQIGLLLALSACTLLLNGLVFWATLEPVRQLRVADVVATNALCTFLAYLPFKLGALTRVAIHNRRDRVPLLTIGAWFGAMLVVMLVAYAPLTAASLWRRGVDAHWWIAGLGGAAVLAAAVVLAARPFAGERGLARLHRLLDGSRLPLVRNLARSERFAQLHAGAAMLACPRAVAITTLLRLLDVGVIASRFVVAGAIVGIVFSWEEAVLVAGAYFLIGVVSPFGLLGAREAGTVWMAGALGLASAGQPAEEVARSLTVLTLFITGTESLVLLAGAAAGVAWLRPDRLLRPGASDTAEVNEATEGRQDGREV